MVLFLYGSIGTYSKWYLCLHFTFFIWYLFHVVPFIKDTNIRCLLYGIFSIWYHLYMDPILYCTISMQCHSFLVSFLYGIFSIWHLVNMVSILYGTMLGLLDPNINSVRSKLFGTKSFVAMNFITFYMVHFPYGIISIRYHFYMSLFLYGTISIQNHYYIV